jgi:hypothetical protein
LIKRKTFEIRGVLFLLVLCMGCGVFYPNDIVEPPEANTGIDPFNFDGILSGTGETFRKKNLNDVLHGNLTYEGSQGYRYSRSELLSRLNTIAGEDRDNDADSISIAWSRPGNSDDILGDTLVLVRDYAITTYNSLGVDTTYEGRSRFRIVHHEMLNTRSILRWYDESSTGAKTFFHPDFGDWPKNE